MSKHFCPSCIGSQFDANAVIDAMILRCLEGVASDDGDGSTKDEDVVESPACHDVIEF